MKTRFVLTIFALAGMAYAAQPVASVTSGAPFYLRGNSVNVAGVPDWTVMSGDEISTQTGQAVILLRNGSRVALSANSRAQIDSSDQTFAVRLLSGSLRVLSASSGLRVYVRGSLTSPSVGDLVSAGGAANTAGAPSAKMLLSVGPISRK